MKNKIKPLAILLIIAAFISSWSGCGRKFTRPPSPEQLFKKAMDRFQDEDWFGSRLLLDSIESEYPGSEIIDKVQYYQGLASFNNKEFIVAENEFRSLVRDFCTSEYAESAQYYTGLSCFKQSLPAERDQTETKEAIEEFRTFIESFRTSPLTDSALIYIKKGNDKLARKIYLNGNIVPEDEAKVS
ncbi:MAG: outer membrane protein assembly factor BamD, partial [Fibrobacterota bacterium]